MSVLNDLIKIKTSAQEDDLIKMLEEVSVYEKLSVNEQFRDLKSSEIARTKCPMLAAFIDNKPYETILAELVANIYLHIEGIIPDIVQITIQRTPKQRKQLEILQTGVVHVEYRNLLDYDHETMKEHLAAVFTKQEQNAVIAAIIIKDINGYKMYHGTYVIEDDNKIFSMVAEPVIIRGRYGVFIMNTYSILGNNGYRFGTYQNEHNIYDTMIGPEGELFLMSGDRVAVNYMIPWEERNNLNLSKKIPEKFAEVVISIIESVVQK